MHGELQVALESLQRRQGSAAQTVPADDAWGASLVVTGSGFFGDDRAAIRELAHLARIAYSGDLVKGYTTHLVLAPGCSSMAEIAVGGNAATRKLAKAAEWGIPCLHLPWLLDSIAAGSLQPTELYMLASLQQKQEQHGTGPAAWQPVGCQRLVGRHRPSSVASNALAADGSSDMHQEAASFQKEPVLPEQQHKESHPSCQPRAALASVDNLLAEQLCCMSISPEVPAAMMELTAAAWPDDSLSEQRSLCGSPQYSLSLQGMVLPTTATAGSLSPGQVASSSQGEESWQQSMQSPEARSASALCAAAQLAGFSPMQDSTPDEKQQQAVAVGQPGRVMSSDERSSLQLFSFSLAAGLGRSISDEPMGGSPMAELPTAAPMMSAGSAGHGSSAASGARWRLGGTLAGMEEGSQEPECTILTPACIRDWSEDGSEFGGTPAAAVGTLPSAAPMPSAAVQEDDGIGQMPPAIWRLLEEGVSPTQVTPQLQQQAQQAAQQHEEAMVMHHQASAALRDWTDDEAEASEPPAAGELVILDSESDAVHDMVPIPQQAQQPAQQQQQVVEGNPLLQQQHPRWLLQISRPSMARQLAAAGTRAPAAAAAPQSKHMAEPTAATPAAEVAPLANVDGKLMRRLGGDWEPAEASGSGETLQRPVPTGDTAPHQLPVRRGGDGDPSRSKQQQQGIVREWSDDSSGSEEFPTPKGNRRAGGLTGLTQLNPSSIVVARPKPIGATANWHGGDASGSGSGGVLGIKWLQRPARGNAVRQHHGLANLKAVQFAEQVQLAVGGGLMLSTKDKKTAVWLQAGTVSAEKAEDEDFMPSSSSSSSAATEPQQQQQQDLVLGEPQAFYRLPDGSWWLEYCRFYTTGQVQETAAKEGHALALPQGINPDCELFKAVERQHAPMNDIAGGVQVRRVKQGSTMLRFHGGGSSRSFFWRTAVDTATWRTVTDRPTADFVAIE